jgi:hypothetical protein
VYSPELALWRALTANDCAALSTCAQGHARADPGKMLSLEPASSNRGSNFSMR